MALHRFSLVNGDDAAVWHDTHRPLVLLVSNSIYETNERTNGQRDTPLCPSVRCVCQTSILCGERSAMLHRNL